MKLIGKIYSSNVSLLVGEMNVKMSDIGII